MNSLKFGLTKEDYICGYIMYIQVDATIVKFSHNWEVVRIGKSS